MKLSKSFYDRDTLKVAQGLLGKHLIFKRGRKKIVGRIVEAEAYCGLDDLASHASRGRTERNEIMFGPAGFVYVYMIYGMYHCLNIVTERKNYPAAVLIRALEIIQNPKNPSTPLRADKKQNKIIAAGPGKLCRYLGLTKKQNGLDITGDTLWVEDRGEKIAPKDVVKTTRIGVDYAKHCKDHKWRFYIKGSPSVSKK